MLKEAPQNRLRKTMLPKEEAPEETKTKSLPKTERMVRKKCGTNRRPRQRKMLLQQRKRRNPNSSTGRRVSPRKEQLMPRQTMLLIKSRLTALILNSHKKSRDSARITKSRAIDPRVRIARLLQLLKMARRKEKQVRTKLMLKETNLLRRRKEAILGLKRPKISFTRIQWSSRKPGNSSLNGRSTDSVIGGRAVAKRL